MNSRVVTAALVSVLGALFAASVSFCCSTVRGYVPPTNYEIVKTARHIALCEAKEYRTDVDGFGEFTFSVLEVLKGEIPVDTIYVRGTDRFEGRGNESDFSSPRPGAFSGGCVATDFRVGKIYLLFLVEDDGRWWVSAPPFTRASEEVAGRDAPWVLTVRRYVAISRLENYDHEVDALERLRLLSMRDTDRGIVPAELGPDIARHFSTPTHLKSLNDLKKFLSAADDQSEKNQILWTITLIETDAATRFLEEVAEGSSQKVYREMLEIQQARKMRSETQRNARQN
jgi:hypothetical protein